MEKEIGPDIEQPSSPLCSFWIPFQGFLFVSHISQAALKLATLPKIPDFPVSTFPSAGVTGNSHRAWFLRQGFK